MTISKCKITALAVLLFISCLATTASAVTINWGNSLLSNLVKSDGSTISAADYFTFQIGAFTDGFTPSDSNATEWFSNWKVLDAATFNPTASFFTSSFNILPDRAGSIDLNNNIQGISDSPEATPGLTMAQGTKLFIMAYNNTAMDSTTEIFLGGDATWNFPAPMENQTTLPLDFRLAAIGAPPVFGGANTLPGGGLTSSNPISYDLQTATFQAPIPEPSALSLTLPLLVFFIRRRR